MSKHDSIPPTTSTVHAKEKGVKKVKKTPSEFMRGDFFKNLSHELRSPLNTIIGFSEMLKDGLAGMLTAKQQNYCEEIFNSGHYLLSLINNILDISKMEAGTLTFEPTLEDIPAFCKKLIDEIKKKGDEQHILCSVQVDHNIQRAFIDSKKLEKVIHSLLDNALKYTLSGGRITLSCKIDSKNRLIFSVKDTGIGISPEHIKNLFQPFFQVKEAQIKQQTGAGLGLMMVKYLSQIHSGKVVVKSELGKGSTFILKIPYIPEDKTSTIDETKPLKDKFQERTLVFESVEASVTPITNENPLALVIEDDSKSAEIIAQHLKQSNVSVEWVKTAEEGLERLEEKPFDLIILDIILPGLNGWQMLSILKQNKNFESIPVVIVSVIADEQQEIELGAVAVLQKPIGRCELTDAIQKYRVKKERNEPFTVLAVDDDPNVLFMIETYLKSNTCKIIAAQNGKAALEEIKKQVPDLIILDLVMPEVTGFDVVESLRNNPKTSEIPVLILTSKTLTDEDRHKLESGVTKILSKNGMSANRFRNEINRIVGH